MLGRGEDRDTCGGTVFALAGGSFIFLAFLILLMGAIVFAYYSRAGSEISQRPFNDRGDSDPTAFRDISQDVRNWSPGAGGAHRRNKPAPRTPEELEQALDPEIRERLVAWRDHLETEDFETGVRSGVDGTPTLFVNGTRHDGDMDAATLHTAVETAAATA